MEKMSIPFFFQLTFRAHRYMIGSNKTPKFPLSFIEERSSPLIENYITSRLEPQILYYEKRSALFRREHNVLSILTLFLMASIPFLTLLLELSSGVRFAIAAVGIATSILSAILYFHNARELWKSYQETAQALYAEKEKYLYSAGAYQTFNSQTEKDARFVETCEAIISRIEQ